MNELAGEGILVPGPDQRFNGDDLINRYLLVDFIGRIVEKLVVEEGAQLETANFAQSYKDIPVSNFAYPSIQKLIRAEVIPAGNRTELFYGDRKISRYQMVFFTFSAIKYVLPNILQFKAAGASLGYGDVPADHFTYDTIQKLIWLGVLEGGKDKQFNGEEFVNRYELAYFSVNLIKAIYLKLKEIETFTPIRPVGYGFKTYLNTQLSALNITNGKAPGQDLNRAAASQTVNLSVDRALDANLSAFASLTSVYNFGDAAGLSAPSLDQAYVLYKSPPFMLQAGRSGFYQGFSPFGSSLFVDTTADMLLGNYDHPIFNLYASIGKLRYAGDISLDSNFGFVNLAPKMPPLLSWLDLSLGSSLVTNPPDPTLTATLPTRLSQICGGVKVNLFNLLEFTGEMGKLTFTNPDVLPLIGAATAEDTEAVQYALTYYSVDYNLSLSLGYQKIGDDYYLANLAIPGTQGTERILFRAKAYPTPAQIISFDFANVTRDGSNLQTVVSGYYNLEIAKAIYLNVGASRTMDNTAARQDQLTLNSSLSISF